MAGVSPHFYTGRGDIKGSVPAIGQSAALRGKSGKQKAEMLKRGERGETAPAPLLFTLRSWHLVLGTFETRECASPAAVHR